MKSRELLDKILQSPITKAVGGCFMKNDELETIKRDLEVLEIIKKWSFIQENYKDGYGTFTQFLCNIHTIGMEKDFNKVKEWLENEKDNI